MSKIVTNLWFDTEAEEAARFYCSVFKNSRMGAISRYPAVGQEVHGMPAGSVMTVDFELDGHHFIGLNGGPAFKFNEAISIVIECRDQAELDHYWNALSAGGDPSAQQCGWLKDKFGVSWQVTPEAMTRMISDPDKAKSERVFQAMLNMKKLDIAELQRAYQGQPASVR